MQNSSTTKDACTHCFKSLGVAAKHKIYAYLKVNTRASVLALVDLVSLAQPTVSYHLKDMQNNGLLQSEKVGKEVYYSINNACPHDQCACVLEAVDFAGDSDISVQDSKGENV